jgi:hypothetical protein
MYVEARNATHAASVVQKNCMFHGSHVYSDLLLVVRFCARLIRDTWTSIRKRLNVLSGHININLQEVEIPGMPLSWPGLSLHAAARTSCCERGLLARLQQTLSALEPTQTARGHWDREELESHHGLRAGQHGQKKKSEDRRKRI